MTETVCVVVVTFNRADLLRGLLERLAALDTVPDAVLVVDNASTDHTAQVLAESANPGLAVVSMAENTGGAGGFHAGVRAAYEAGWDRIWLMDDDVLPAPDCLDVLLAVDPDHAACLMVTREDSAGRLVEKAATDFDLTHATALRPKRASVETTYRSRGAMPELVELQNVPFEGFMVRREVVSAVGLPDPSFFIFYDDVDYALRARRAGFRIWGVRDAVVVRRLDFDQQHDLAGWKGFYMYRNLFVVHLRYGATAAVRLKPWLLTAAVVVLSPLRGGVAEARNVIRAMRSARTMRSLPPASVD
ncbi:glycosyltransferase family 2 protein [Nocardioides mangrovicus]|uniref:glycosyltransferase family 2 protein n=1 Tax=Nocardioides mangrovicus TaxID=2478913 RepID=UPI001E3214F9|nr:glycosyltransferase family 2 protein [Nocardioides mangrovicus]